jgi:hypothetical protein
MQREYSKAVVIAFPGPLRVDPEVLVVVDGPDDPQPAATAASVATRSPPAINRRPRRDGPGRG